MLLSQVIIFVLGWPLEWTEIIVIFMPIFIPLLDNFGIDPLFFGLLVALNLQTAFLSPPVAMAAFYLKGVSPPHVTLNQIFAGMLPFMGIQVVAIFLLYVFPQIGLWLPSVLYGRMSRSCAGALGMSARCRLDSRIRPAHNPRAHFAAIMQALARSILPGHQRPRLRRPALCRDDAGPACIRVRGRGARREGLRPCAS